MEPLEPGENEDWPPGPGNFGYFTRIEVNPLNPTPITAIAFDPIEELIWSGNSNVGVFIICIVLVFVGKSIVILWREQLQ